MSSSSHWRIIEHTVPCQHIREYPAATARTQEDILHLAVKQYIPTINPTPLPGDLTIVIAPGTGYPKAFYQTWDSRVFARLVAYGLRDDQKEFHVEGEHDRCHEPMPVRLATPLIQHLASLGRPYHDLPAPDAGPHDSRNRLTHPDLDPELLTSFPFYRPEITALFPRLPYLRPSVLYIYGSKSNLSLPEFRSDKRRTTGIATGGSGGAAAGRVREVVIQGYSHQVPFEAVNDCADEVACWLACESRRWSEEERVFRDRQGSSPAGDHTTVEKRWKVHFPKGQRGIHMQGHIAIVTINRPDRLNALNQDHYYQHGNIFRELERTADITMAVLTGTGRFFSAGTDVSSTFENMSHGTDVRRHMSSTFFSNLDLTQIFIDFSKILIVALNGPVVGFSAALIAQGDFIFAAPDTYLLTPFSSLGIAAEGAASRSFVRRLGIAKANEALIMSKRISCEELVASGFVNEVIHAPSGQPDDSTGFLEQVLGRVHELFGSVATQSSLLSMKNRIDNQQNCDEIFAGLEMVTTGVPEQQMRAIGEGRKKHKL
ncbi:hypothetical protein ASPBRDRAFT_60214 [Aspergillus brasiliensis CBS 101740]|uniref:Uncharacterized protein n=1 Tax=Aspergillus brasiliensis (strain CBS 101740 / IMI 381727 / IBT 21946) TaxID=767769 RepID=A0A1L9U2H9_ASPBC|nr:hypothetical protein ASPBRDRAFT_60214 [Aspergillus brasiliensis CBS 101740]